MIAVDSLKVKRARQGDADAFAALMQERKTDLYRMLYAYVRNQEDTLDIIHDGVYKAFLSIGKLKYPEYFNTWIIKIMMNTCRDHARRRRTRQQKENPYFEQSDLEQIPVEEVIEQDVISQLDLWHAMETLQEELKAIVLLKYYQDLTLVEIAEVLSMPVGTVKSRLHRALSLLKAQLKEGYHES